MENIVNNVSRADQFISSRISFMLQVSNEIQAYQRFILDLRAHLANLVGIIPLSAFVEARKPFLAHLAKDFQKLLNADASTTPQIDLKRLESACLELERQRIMSFLEEASPLLGYNAK